ncbi:MAG: cold-shock protein [Planctomycetota bacterium]|nr:MAG: cold-shock protein [Planctomycetota bacterium]
MSTGKVKWYDDQRGFGFIQSDDGGPDIFVHKSEIDIEGSCPLGEGQCVEFEIKTSPKGPVATSVKPVDA